MGMGKTRRTGGTVNSRGAQSMKTEGPGTDEAGVLVADVMDNAVLLLVEAPATRDCKFDVFGEPSIIWEQICLSLRNL